MTFEELLEIQPYSLNKEQKKKNIDAAISGTDTVAQGTLFGICTNPR